MRRKVEICSSTLICSFCTSLCLTVKSSDLILLADQKDEKESVKTEDLAKLQNGDGGKDGGAGAASEEKKKAKTRFMFNIADGGFTGKYYEIFLFLFGCFFV